MSAPTDFVPTVTQRIEALDVGESADFPLARKITARRTASRLQERHNGRRYVCRSIPDGSYQVWRTA